jgi:hypothetical protein
MKSAKQLISEINAGRKALERASKVECNVNGLRPGHRIMTNGGEIKTIESVDGNFIKYVDDPDPVPILCPVVYVLNT